jgi:membrane protein involved in colicin uptake
VLLQEIAQKGMSDELDQRLAAFIEKAKRTVKAMNERRSPVTKLFDQVRSEFTVLENTINPTVKDTIPFQLQSARNKYAAEKRAEEERRRAEEAARAEVIRAKETYRASVDEDYQKAFNNLVNSAINELTKINSGVTLENYQAAIDTITGYATTIPADWCPPSSIRIPFNLTPEEAREIRTEQFKKLWPRFEEQYTFEVGDYRNELLDKLPSKKTELERAAQADAAEAARIKAELAQREAAEAARKEAERRQAEAEARQKAEMDKANADMLGLFAVGKVEEQTYTAKTKVAKKIKINSPQAFLGIVSLWWQREGCTLSVEELSKIFKKQVTYCEKLANKENVLVDSNDLEYVEEVKAQ